MADPFAAGPEPELVASDDSVIAIAKPPRMHTAPGRSAESLCAWVFSRFPDAARAARASRRPEAEGGLLHRLDYETSGLVLFARSPEALEFLLREQSEGRFVKEYLLRACPSQGQAPEGSRPPRSRPRGPGADEWDQAFAREDAPGLAGLLCAPGFAEIESAFRGYGPGSARVACLGPEEGQLSEPRAYATAILEARAEGEGLEILASIRQGFRHQIRAQLAWIGLPILGDPLYGGKPADRLFLHATRLRFRHPATGVETTVQ